MTPSQVVALKVMGLRPYLSDSLPQTGENMAKEIKLEPKIMPAHLSISPVSVTPMLAIYSGSIGASWLMPTETMKLVTQQINRFRFQISIFRITTYQKYIHINYNIRKGCSTSCYTLIFINSTYFDQYVNNVQLS